MTRSRNFIGLGWAWDTARHGAAGPGKAGHGKAWNSAWHGAERRGDVRCDIAAVRVEGDGLRILTHPEQAEHVKAMEEQSIRRFGRAVVQGQAVDLAKLGDEQRSAHERWLLRSAFRLQQIRKQLPPELRHSAPSLPAPGAAQGGLGTDDPYRDSPSRRGGRSCGD